MTVYCIFRMDCELGFIGQGFALVGGDSCARRSILTYSQDHDRFTQLSSTCGLVGGGEDGDRVSYFVYAAHIILYLC